MTFDFDLLPVIAGEFSRPDLLEKFCAEKVALGYVVLSAACHPAGNEDCGYSEYFAVVMALPSAISTQHRQPQPQQQHQDCAGVGPIIAAWPDSADDADIGLLLQMEESAEQSAAAHE